MEAMINLKMKNYIRSCLVTLVLSMIGLAGASPIGGTLSELCSGQKVKLETVNDLEAFAKQVDSASGTCLPRVMEALKAMNSIARDERTCSMDKAEAITKFVDDYLKRAQVGAGTKDELPEALADFAVAYGMQVSKMCSREMIERFAPHANALIYERLGSQDYIRFRNFKEDLLEKSPLGLLLAAIIKTGEILLPTDLMQLMPEMEALRFELEVSDGGSANWIKNLCSNMLQPMYEPIVLPLAHLIRAGFNSKTKYRDREQKGDGRFWSAAVFLCETLKSLDVKEGEQGAALDKLDEVVVEEMANSQKLEGDDECVQPAAGSTANLYQSEGQIEDKIVSPSMRSLVRSFEANKNEIERLRDMILNRSLRILRVLYTKGHNGLKFRNMIKMIKAKEGTDADKLNEVRATILELVHSKYANSCPFTALERADKGHVIEHERKGFEPIGLIIILILVGTFTAASITAAFGKRKRPRA